MKKKIGGIVVFLLMMVLALSATLTVSAESEPNTAGYIDIEETFWSHPYWNHPYWDNPWQWNHPHWDNPWQWNHPHWNPPWHWNHLHWNNPWHWNPSHWNNAWHWDNPHWNNVQYWENTYWNNPWQWNPWNHPNWNHPQYWGNPWQARPATSGYIPEPIPMPTYSQVLPYHHQDSHVAASTPISVGTQWGAPNSGIVNFPVTTNGIQNGHYNVSITGLPLGATAPSTARIHQNVFNPQLQISDLQYVQSGTYTLWLNVYNENGAPFAPPVAFALIVH